MPRTIAIDIDGVLADIEKPIHDRIHAHFGVPMNEIKKDAFYMHERFDIEPKIMTEFLQTQVFTDTFMWLEATPFAENIEALRIIWERGTRIALVTGRNNDVRDATTAWLDLNGVYYDSLLMSALQVKHKAMKFIGAELLVEDRYGEADTVASQGLGSYMVRREYNVKHEPETNPNIVWINSLYDMKTMEKL